MKAHYLLEIILTVPVCLDPVNFSSRQLNGIMCDIVVFPEQKLLNMKLFLN